MIALAWAILPLRSRWVSSAVAPSARVPVQRELRGSNLPQLDQEVRADRRDFLRHRIARHFRSLPRQGSVSVGVRRLSGAIPGASCRKSLAANFRFQGCCLPRVHRAHFERQFGVRTSTLDPTSDGTVGSAPRGKANEQGIVPYACAGAWSPSVRH